MICQVNAGHDEFYSNVDVLGFVQTSPRDFRRTCVNPSRPDFNLMPDSDDHMSSKLILQVMKMLMARKPMTPPTNASAFTFVGFSASAYELSRDKSDPHSSERAAGICAHVLFVDDIVLDWCKTVPCQAE